MNSARAAMKRIKMIDDADNPWEAAQAVTEFNAANQAEVRYYRPREGPEQCVAGAITFPDGSGLLMRCNPAEDPKGARWDLTTAYDAKLEAELYASARGWPLVAYENHKQRN